METELEIKEKQLWVEDPKQAIGSLLKKYNIEMDVLAEIYKRRQDVHLFYDEKRRPITNLVKGLLRDKLPPNKVAMLLNEIARLYINKGTYNVSLCPPNTIKQKIVFDKESCFRNGSHVHDLNFMQYLHEKHGLCYCCYISRNGEHIARFILWAFNGIWVAHNAYGLTLYEILPILKLAIEKREACTLTWFFYQANVVVYTNNENVLVLFDPQKHQYKNFKSEIFERAMGTQVICPHCQASAGLHMFRESENQGTLTFSCGCIEEIATCGYCYERIRPTDQYILSVLDDCYYHLECYNEVATTCVVCHREVPYENATQISDTEYVCLDCYDDSENSSDELNLD